MKFKLVEDTAAEKVAEQEIESLPQEEETLLKQVMNRVKFTPIDNPSHIENALDAALRTSIRALKYGRETAGAAANIMLVGQAGTGKTAIVKKWAKERNVNLVAKNASSFDKTDMGGAVAAKVDETGKTLNQVTRLSNSEFDDLVNAGSVLFLDELNRADPEIMGSLLTLILDHKVPDTSAKGGMKSLPGFLFTIAAINPADEAYEGTNELDTAMRNRFRRLDVTIDIPQYRKHIIGELEQALKVDEKTAKEDPSEWNLEDLTASQGRLKLVKTILNSPLFAFDDIEAEREATEMQVSTLSPRSFSAIIRACDGTKADLLRLWPDYCNPNKLDMIEAILTDYVDIDDKANNALKYKDGFLDDEESIFGNKESAWDKLQGLL